MSVTTAPEKTLPAETERAANGFYRVGVHAIPRQSLIFETPVHADALIEFQTGDPGFRVQFTLRAKVQLFAEMRRGVDAVQIRVGFAVETDSRIRMKRELRAAGGSKRGGLSA